MWFDSRRDIVRRPGRSPAPAIEYVGLPGRISGQSLPQPEDLRTLAERAENTRLVQVRPKEAW